MLLSNILHFYSNNHFTQGENEGYQADGDENARNIPTHVREGDKIDEDFDPWALPELQDLGPKWSGRLRGIVYVATLSVLLFKMQGTECKAFVRRNLTNLFVLYCNNTRTEILNSSETKALDLNVETSFMQNVSMANAS